MTDEALDVFARQLLLDASHLEVSSAPQEKHTFSPDFERKMKKMIRRVEHPVRHRVGQIAACVLLVAVLGFSSVMAFSAEARAAVFGWIREVYETYFVYRYEGAEQSMPEDAIYRPTNIPNGYYEIIEPALGDFVHAVYKNDGEQFITFSYLIGRNRTVLNLQLEGVAVRESRVGTMGAELYLNENSGVNTLVWTDDEKDIAFWLSGALTGGELVEIAESIEAAAPGEVVYRPTWIKPGSYYMDEPTEAEGSGSIVYVNENEERTVFGYSGDGLPAGIAAMQAGRDAGSATVGGKSGMLWSAWETGASSVIVWTDDEAGLTFWLSAPLTDEELIQMAESVKVKASGFTDVMTENWDAPKEAGEVYDFSDGNAEWTAFLAQVEEYARRDAPTGVYMSSEFIDFKNEFLSRNISPDRDLAIAEVSRVMDAIDENKPGETVLILAGAPYTANIWVGASTRVTAEIYNEYGEMIAGYHSDNGEWNTVGVAAESEFAERVGPVYRAAYQEARTEIETLQD